MVGHEGQGRGGLTPRMRAIPTNGSPLLHVSSFFALQCVNVPPWLQIGEDIAKETAKEWKGLRVTVKLSVQNRQAKVSVIPSAAALVIKALKEPPRDRKKEKNVPHNGSVPLEEIYQIARIMRDRSCAASFKGSVKEILGTCVSVGCKVEGEDPRDLQEQVWPGTGPALGAVPILACMRSGSSF